MEQSLRLLQEVGQECIQDHLHLLTDYLASQLLERGYQLLTPMGPEPRSGILTVCHPQRSAHDLWQRLHAARIIAAVREGGVRISPHLYNTRDEMDAVVDALEGSK